MKGAGSKTGVGVRPVLGSWYMKGAGVKPLMPDPAAVIKACGRAVREEGAVDDASELYSGLDIS